jgi:hypothetical protein
MRELSYGLAFIAALFLLWAALAWWRIISEPEQEATEGRVEFDSLRVRAAARATALALGMSGLAAVVAVLGWFVR